MAYNRNANIYEGYIYCITNNVNGKQYIGQTNRDIQTRFAEHIRHSKYDNDNKNHCIVLLKAIRKYGAEQFSCDAIKTITAKSKDELSLILDTEEKNAIKQYNTLLPFGYNMTSGGDHSFVEGMTKKVAQYNFDGSLVRIYNSETEALNKTGIYGITAVVYGKKTHAGGYMWRLVENLDNVPTKIEPYQNGLRICRIIQIDFDGNIVGVFNSIKEASDTNNISNVLIGDCINKRYGRLTAGGFRWEKIGFDEDISKLHYEKYLYKKSKNNSQASFVERKVNMYDLDDNYIKTFPTVTEASIFIKKNISNIINCCKKKQKTSGGYKWFYADDINQPNQSLISDKPNRDY